MKSVLTNCAAAAALVCVLVAPTLADAPHNINWRRHHQQERIHQGFANHNLNRRQMHALEGREHRFHQTEMRDRAHDNGHLTNRERVNLSHRQNRMSHAIWHKKHNQ